MPWCFAKMAQTLLLSPPAQGELAAAARQVGSRSAFAAPWTLPAWEKPLALWEYAAASSSLYSRLLLRQSSSSSTVPRATGTWCTCILWSACHRYPIIRLSPKKKKHEEKTRKKNRKRPKQSEKLQKLTNYHRTAIIFLAEPEYQNDFIEPKTSRT